MTNLLIYWLLGEYWKHVPTKKTTRH